MEDVCLIAEEMQKNGWCPAGQMPQSVIAWDLVRLVNLGRWAYLCDYIREDEMWHIMQVAADTALEHFSSWEEYGRSFIMGRGVWHGDPTDSETAYEIVELLLKNVNHPGNSLCAKNNGRNLYKYEIIWTTIFGYPLQ